MTCLFAPTRPQYSWNMRVSARNLAISRSLSEMILLTIRLSSAFSRRLWYVVGVEQLNKSLKLGFAVVTALSSVFVTKPVQAATLYNNWYYAIDANNDGSGGSTYEYQGLAYRIVGNTVYFAVSSGMPLTGNSKSGALNDNVGQGDLILNFSGHNLDTAAKFQDSKVFGIRFDSTNDSFSNTSGTPNNTTGLFKNITVTGLTSQNSGYATLQDYINAGYGRTLDAMGDLESSTGDVAGYFGTGQMLPNMLTGTKVEDITLLNKSQLSGVGLDFNHFGADPSGNNVFGFSLDRTLLPTGNFTGSLFVECINDGVAINGTNVPEPSTLALLGAGLTSVCVVFRRRRARRK